ncbi:hypothetical protein [Pararhodonellum marinum]|uniref:hypothetical protein n=1 Tax=Pararhodonellum marinum TaxID=2755358 RepID=UPI0018902F3D|nr:hypothetical protein [Pararhodonellum marinum]
MNRKLKYGFLIIGIIITSIVGFIGFGLYAMEVEDHYGDLQEIFYSAKSGDLILNKTTSDFGRVEKGWTRIQIKKSNKEIYDLYNWVYQNGVKTEIELYRPSKKLSLDKISYNELTNLIENKDLKLINHN